MVIEVHLRSPGGPMREASVKAIGIRPSAVEEIALSWMRRNVRREMQDGDILDVIVDGTALSKRDSLCWVTETDPLPHLSKVLRDNPAQATAVFAAADRANKQPE